MIGAAKFDVNYSCRLCIPLEMTQVIFKVDKLNKRAISLKNGPIIMIITMDRINDNFFIDKLDRLRYKTEGESSEILKNGDFVKATIQTITFNQNSENIITIGYLDEMATEIEKIDFFRSQYGDTDKFISYEDYKKKMEESKDELSDDESIVESDAESADDTHRDKVDDSGNESDE